MKKICFILFCLLAICFCRAQRSEIGTIMGTSFYLGDLNNIPFKDAKFAGGLIYRYNFSSRFALKANILFGNIAGADKKNPIRIINEDGNIISDSSGRGLSFSSPFTEISAQFEINFFTLYNIEHKNQIAPYLFGGVALFSYNPKAVYPKNGNTYDLQPIGTEGQGREGKSKKYPLTGVGIPFGIGFKANFGRYVCIGAEWGLRFTFTDYLDDVGGLYYNFEEDKTIPAASREIIEYFGDPSIPKHNYNSQRYSTKKTDWYSFAGIFITVRIGNEDRICDIKTKLKKSKLVRKR